MTTKRLMKQSGGGGSLHELGTFARTSARKSWAILPFDTCAAL
jgi:hypothetical protein